MKFVAFVFVLLTFFYAKLCSAKNLSHCCIWSERLPFYEFTEWMTGFLGERGEFVSTRAGVEIYLFSIYFDYS